MAVPQLPAGCGCRKAACCSLTPRGHETKHKRHHFPPSHLLSLGNREGQANGNRDPRSNTYLRLPTMRICHGQPPLPPVFANSAVAVFSPFLLGSDKSLSFQYISYLLQRLFWTSVSTWNRRLLKNSASCSSTTPASLSV